MSIYWQESVAATFTLRNQPHVEHVSEPQGRDFLVDTI